MCMYTSLPFRVFWNVKNSMHNTSLFSLSMPYIHEQLINKI